MGASRSAKHPRRNLALGSRKLIATSELSPRICGTTASKWPTALIHLRQMPQRWPQTTAGWLKASSNSRFFARLVVP